MSRGILSTTAFLRATMERPDSGVAGQLPASGDTAGICWRQVVGSQSLSTCDESVMSGGRDFGISCP
jgi:hypothetical protein